jgi:hypothetical protein
MRRNDLAMRGEGKVTYISKGHRKKVSCTVRRATAQYLFKETIMFVEGEREAWVAVRGNIVRPRFGTLKLSSHASMCSILKEANAEQTTFKGGCTKDVSESRYVVLFDAPLKVKQP